MILYRPVGTSELELIERSGFKQFPPRLPEQPIFYPVLNEKYAAEIAEKWNVKSTDDRRGYVTRFEVEDEYISRFEVQTVGKSYHQELWIPAEELEEFNSHIIGRIEVIAEFSNGNKAHIRRATQEDISRIAEILVFAKRMKYRSIFNDDAYLFGELQVLPVAKKYIENGFLNNMFLYDDGIVKGLIRIEKEEIIELYVDHFFQGEGIGSELIEYAKENYSVNYLWTIEKNIDAVRFYEAHGFHLTDTRKLEEGTTEYIVMMRR